MNYQSPMPLNFYLVEPVQESEFRLMAKAQGLVDLTLGPNVAPDIVQPDSMGRWIESLEVSLLIRSNILS